METALLILLLIILTISLIIILVSTVMLTYSSAISAVPLVPVKRNAINTIMEALELSPGDRLYDLGSGDGRVLRAALDREPDITAIGLEIGPWPRLLSKINLRKYGPRVQIYNQDFFDSDLKNATHIYIYLFPSILTKLKPMFDQQLSPGTRVVSCDFPLPNKTPDKIITVPNNKRISKNIYVYTW
jgi:hypothetical protein